MGDTVIDEIGATAFDVAALRAGESAHAGRLFDDPLAAGLVARGGHRSERDGDASAFTAIMSEQVAVRTRYLDDHLLDAARSGCDQVVLVAAGMDSRAYRIAWPRAVTVFEIDQPAVVGFKADALGSIAARCVHRPVAADLRGEWGAALLDAGFRPDRRTAWLLEGLLYALDEAGSDLLLERVGALSPAGSTVALDQIEAGPALRAALADVDRTLAELWLGGPADPAEWLRRHGWEPSVEILAAVAHRYGRVVHPEYDPARGGTSGAWLATATRR